MNSDKLAADILAALKGLFGERWSQFKATERKLLASVSADFASLAAELAAGTMTPVQAQREKAQLLAQLANLKSAGEAAVGELVLSAVRIAIRATFAALLA